MDALGAPKRDRNPIFALTKFVRLPSIGVSRADSRILAAGMNRVDRDIYVDLAVGVIA